MIAVLAAAILAVYWQVGGHAFVNFDDDQIVSGNRHVLQGLTWESISWAFTTFHASNWHPLTWLSHMLDVEMFGPSPGWHHRVNALFHLLNTELLFLVLWRMTGAISRGAFGELRFPPSGRCPSWRCPWRPGRRPGTGATAGPSFRGR